MFLRKKINCGAEDGARRSQTYFFPPKLSSKNKLGAKKNFAPVFINLWMLAIRNCGFYQNKFIHTCG